MTHFRIGIAAVCIVGVMSAQKANAQFWKEDVGYNKLVAEQGAGLEDGTGVNAVVVEYGGLLGNVYFPQTTDSEFTGKTFTDGSGSTASSAHATQVGHRYFGLTQSMAPGVTDINVFEANDYVGNKLGFNSGADPISHSGFHVSNHSYDGDVSNAVAQDILERLDFVIDTYDMTSIVAGTAEELLTPGYNSIAVGLNTASSGYETTFYGAGRSKPDIVVPLDQFISYSTPIVSSAASLLYEKAVNMGAPDGHRSETMKAILMAGATKDEFPSWSRTTTSPLDDTHGAGELNIYNSYHILDAGEMNGATGVEALVGSTGWDYGATIDPFDPLSWTFSIAGLHEFSLMLNWNMHITDTDGSGMFTASQSLANMDLRLYDSTNTLIDSSLSTVDNLEHIYLSSLDTGTYRIEVSSDIATDFGLAWRANAVPEPGAGLIACLIAICALGQRRSKRVTSAQGTA